MTSINKILVLTIALLSSHAEAAATPEFPLVSGRNAVSFDDSQFNNDYIGMGFVLDYQGQLYGVTAKHVLLVVNHPQIKHVDPAPVLRSWQMSSPETTLELGQLLNADATEALDMSVLERDALVFRVTDPGPFTPIKLSANPPAIGEELFALGCTFASADDCTQDVYAGRLLQTTEHNLLLDLDQVEPGSLRGLSGGPVVNAEGELVGIVSNVMPDADGVARFAPANLDYLRSVLNRLAG